MGSGPKKKIMIKDNIKNMEQGTNVMKQIMETKTQKKKKIIKK
jgi:hypothetical protein